MQHKLCIIEAPLLTLQDIQQQKKFKKQSRGWGWGNQPNPLAEKKNESKHAL